MPTKIRARSENVNKRGFTYLPRGISSGSPAGIHESDFRGGNNQKIETLLTDIVKRLERIEEKIDETVYPPESAIKPEFVKRVKKAQAEIAAGKGKTYNSMDDFIRAISE